MKVEEDMPNGISIPTEYMHRMCVILGITGALLFVMFRFGMKTKTKRLVQRITYAPTIFKLQTKL